MAEFFADDWRFFSNDWIFLTAEGRNTELERVPTKSLKPKDVCPICVKPFLDGQYSIYIYMPLSFLSFPFPFLLHFTSLSQDLLLWSPPSSRKTQRKVRKTKN